jgi:hypothetical protein
MAGTYGIVRWTRRSLGAGTGRRHGGRGRPDIGHGTASSGYGNGRPPVGVERMLRIYFLQQWFNLSDPAMEEAL